MKSDDKPAKEPHGENSNHHNFNRASQGKVEEKKRLGRRGRGCFLKEIISKVNRKSH